MCRKVISEETKRSREIDEELEKEKRETMRKIRLLLLGNKWVCTIINQPRNGREWKEYFLQTNEGNIMSS